MQPLEMVRSRAGTVAIVSLIALTTAACGKGDKSTGDTAAATGSVGQSEPATTAQADRDAQTVESYRLTMDKVNRFYDAFREGTIAVGNRTETDSLADLESLDQMVNLIEREPKVVAAIRKAGLSPREYVVITMAMATAGMAEHVLKMQPKANVDSLAREMEVPAENIRFVHEHWAEIEAKGNAAKAAIRAAGVNID